MEFDLTPRQEGEFWDYDDDMDSPPETRLRFLITRLTPEIKSKAQDESVLITQVNGQYRRQMPSVKTKPGVYQAVIFRECCKGWENLNAPKPPRGTGEPIPFTPETLHAMSLQFDGAVQFVNDIAEMMGRMSLEKIQEERARFRSVLETSRGQTERELPDV